MAPATKSCSPYSIIDRTAKRGSQLQRCRREDVSGGNCRRTRPIDRRLVDEAPCRFRWNDYSRRKRMMDRLAGPIGAHTRACTCGPFIGTRGDQRRGAKESKRRMNSDYNETQINPRHAESRERAVALSLHVCRSVGGSSTHCTPRRSNHARVAITRPHVPRLFRDTIAPTRSA